MSGLPPVCMTHRKALVPKDALYRNTCGAAARRGLCVFRVRTGSAPVCCGTVTIVRVCCADGGSPARVPATPPPSPQKRPRVLFWTTCFPPGTKAGEGRGHPMPVALEGHWFPPGGRRGPPLPLPGALRVRAQRGVRGLCPGAAALPHMLCAPDRVLPSPGPADLCAPRLTR